MGQSPFAKRPTARDPGPGRRRSTRVDHVTPIVLAGRDAQGNPFHEDTETRTVNLHGAKVRTRHHLLVGMQVTVENPMNGMSAKGIVVWAGEPTGGGSEREIALQLLSPMNLWALENPPADWGITEEPGPRILRAPREPSAPVSEQRVTATIDSALQNLESRIGAIVRRNLFEFERKMQELVTQAEARLSERSDQAFADLDAALQTFRNDLEVELAERKDEIIAAAEEALRRKASEMVSRPAAPAKPAPVGTTPQPTRKS